VRQTGTQKKRKKNMASSSSSKKAMKEVLTKPTSLPKGAVTWMKDAKKMLKQFTKALVEESDIAKIYKETLENYDDQAEALIFTTTNFKQDFEAWKKNIGKSIIDEWQTFTDKNIAVLFILDSLTRHADLRWLGTKEYSRPWIYNGILEYNKDMEIGIRHITGPDRDKYDRAKLHSAEYLQYIQRTYGPEVNQYYKTLLLMMYMRSTEVLEPAPLFETPAVTSAQLRAVFILIALGHYSAFCMSRLLPFNHSALLGYKILAEMGVDKWVEIHNVKLSAPTVARAINHLFYNTIFEESVYKPRFELEESRLPQKLKVGARQIIGDRLGNFVGAWVIDYIACKGKARDRSPESFMNIPNEATLIFRQHLPVFSISRNKLETLEVKSPSRVSAEAIRKFEEFKQNRNGEVQTTLQNLFINDRVECVAVIHSIDALSLLPKDFIEYLEKGPVVVMDEEKRQTLIDMATELLRRFIGAIDPTSPFLSQYTRFQGNSAALEKIIDAGDFYREFRQWQSDVTDDANQAWIEYMRQSFQNLGNVDDSDDIFLLALFTLIQITYAVDRSSKDVPNLFTTIQPFLRYKESTNLAIQNLLTGAFFGEDKQAEKTAGWLQEHPAIRIPRQLTLLYLASTKDGPIGTLERGTFVRLALGSAVDVHELNSLMMFTENLNMAIDMLLELHKQMPVTVSVVSLVNILRAWKWIVEHRDAGEGELSVPLLSERIVDICFARREHVDLARASEDTIAESAENFILPRWHEHIRRSMNLPNNVSLSNVSIRTLKIKYDGKEYDVTPTFYVFVPAARYKTEILQIRDPVQFTNDDLNIIDKLIEDSTLLCRALSVLFMEDRSGCMTVLWDMWSNSARDQESTKLLLRTVKTDRIAMISVDAIPQKSASPSSPSPSASDLFTPPPPPSPPSPPLESATSTPVVDMGTASSSSSSSSSSSHNPLFVRATHPHMRTYVPSIEKFVKAISATSPLKSQYIRFKTMFLKDKNLQAKALESAVGKTRNERRVAVVAAFTLEFDEWNQNDKLLNRVLYLDDEFLAYDKDLVESIEDYMDDAAKTQDEIDCLSYIKKAEKNLNAIITNMYAISMETGVVIYKYRNMLASIALGRRNDTIYEFILNYDYHAVKTGLFFQWIERMTVHLSDYLRPDAISKAIHVFKEPDMDMLAYYKRVTYVINYLICSNGLGKNLPKDTDVYECARKTLFDNWIARLQDDDEVDVLPKSINDFYVTETDETSQYVHRIQPFNLFDYTVVHENHKHYLKKLRTMAQEAQNLTEEERKRVYDFTKNTNDTFDWVMTQLFMISKAWLIIMVQIYDDDDPSQNVIRYITSTHIAPVPMFRQEDEIESKEPASPPTVTIPMQEDTDSSPSPSSPRVAVKHSSLLRGGNTNELDLLPAQLRNLDSSGTKPGLKQADLAEIEKKVAAILAQKEERALAELIRQRSPATPSSSSFPTSSASTSSSSSSFSAPSSSSSASSSFPTTSASTTSSTTTTTTTLPSMDSSTTFSTGRNEQDVNELARKILEISRLDDKYYRSYRHWAAGKQLVPLDNKNRIALTLPRCVQIINLAREEWNMYRLFDETGVVVQQCISFVLQAMKCFGKYAASLIHNFNKEIAEEQFKVSDVSTIFLIYAAVHTTISGLEQLDRVLKTCSGTSEQQGPFISLIINTTAEIYRQHPERFWTKPAAQSGSSASQMSPLFPPPPPPPPPPPLSSSFSTTSSFLSTTPSTPALIVPLPRLPSALSPPSPPSSSSESGEIDPSPRILLSNIRQRIAKRQREEEEEKEKEEEEEKEKEEEEENQPVWKRRNVAGVAQRVFDLAMSSAPSSSEPIVTLASSTPPMDSTKKKARTGLLEKMKEHMEKDMQKTKKQQSVRKITTPSQQATKPYNYWRDGPKPDEPPPDSESESESDPDPSPAAAAAAAAASPPSVSESTSSASTSSASAFVSSLVSDKSNTPQELFEKNYAKETEKFQDRFKKYEEQLVKPYSVQDFSFNPSLCEKILENLQVVLETCQDLVEKINRGRSMAIFTGNGAKLLAAINGSKTIKLLVVYYYANLMMIPVATPGLNERLQDHSILYFVLKIGKVVEEIRQTVIKLKETKSNELFYLFFKHRLQREEDMHLTNLNMEQLEMAKGLLRYMNTEKEFKEGIEREMLHKSVTNPGEVKEQEEEEEEEEEKEDDD
jgi:hypothetical protein